MGRHKLCECGCGEPAGARWKYKRGHKPKGAAAKKAADSPRSDEEKRIVRPNGHANSQAVSVPEAALDKWFHGLDDKERAELQGRLWSQLPAELKALVFAGEVGA
jgi:hypothetical protein